MKKIMPYLVLLIIFLFIGGCKSGNPLVRNAALFGNESEDTSFGDVDCLLFVNDSLYTSRSMTLTEESPNFNTSFQLLGEYIGEVERHLPFDQIPSKPFTSNCLGAGTKIYTSLEKEHEVWAISKSGITKFELVEDYDGVTQSHDESFVQSDLDFPPSNAEERPAIYIEDTRMLCVGQKKYLDGLKDKRIEDMEFLGEIAHRVSHYDELENFYATEEKPQSQIFVERDKRDEIVRAYVTSASSEEYNVYIPW